MLFLLFLIIFAFAVSAFDAFLRIWRLMQDRWRFHGARKLAVLGWNVKEDFYL
jgi:hypothetical protein